MAPLPESSVEVAKIHDVPLEVRRLDYKEPQFFICETELDLQLDFENTKVKTTHHVLRNIKCGAFVSDLTLYGANTITLESIHLQTSPSSESQLLKRGEHYEISPVDSSLTIKGIVLPEKPAEVFNVILVSYVNPSSNSEFLGLYKSGPILVTQMEAEGFRRMTYSLDRPDVISKYKVRLEGDKSKFPVLLSNGNQIESGDLPNGRHFVVFEDPFPKPSYLFAIVAGNLVSKEDSFICSDKKKTRLSLWCEPKDCDKFDWALNSLKKAMKWDEDKFGRVYDLNLFNIVAISHFNMGAMENKSLNVFNSSRILAHKQISTDEEFLGVMAIVGHEYFHNWTGNRVSCRDWFQLSLKEGLTVYRHQEFSKDMSSRVVERIKEALFIRSFQFPEDFGSLAHSVRPDSYQRIENFYTPTVYQKGAEVVRMYERILGKEGFRKGMDLYFKRHDGQSVTCDDFRAAMSDANNVDLTQFERWYCQAGTPVVTVESMQYNAGDQSCTIVLKQTCCVQSKQSVPNKAFHIPVIIGLIGRQSHKELVCSTVQFKEEKQTFAFKNINEEPVLSIFRDFCAPVKVVAPSMTDADYGILMSFDNDGFNRWEAGQKLMTKVVLERATRIRDAPNKIEAVVSTPTLDLILHGFKKMLVEAQSAIETDKDSMTDLHFVSFALLVPTVATLMSDFSPCNPMALHSARTDVRKFIGVNLEKEFIGIYDSLTKLTSSMAWDLTTKSMGIRSLRNTVLSYLTIATDQIERAVQHYKSSDNMNDRIAAFAILVNYPKQEATKSAITDFFTKAGDDASVIDKWFSAQASAETDCVIDCVRELKKHKMFDISHPNRMRSLLSSFAANPQFHNINGKGYKFIAESIMELDKLNSKLAATLAKNLASWKMMDFERQMVMKTELTNLANQGLSSCLKEVVSKSLES